MNRRDSVLRELLNFSKSAGLLATALEAFEWDFDGAPLEITREHIRSVLSRYVIRELSAQDVEDWANLVEGREDIDFESNHAGALGECLHELANPDLTGKLSVRRAEELIHLIDHG